MRNLMWLATLVAIGGAGMALAAGDLTLKSAKAKDARAGYDAEVKRAAEEYRAKVGKAARTYADALKQAKLGAMKTGNLEEANAIQAEIKLMEHDAPDPKAGDGLVIDRAIYAWGDKVEDVTKQILKKRKDDSIFDVLHGDPNFPDPAAYKNKVFAIHGTYFGQEFSYTIRTSPFDDGGCSFGKVPEPEVAKMFAGVKK